MSMVVMRVPVAMRVPMAITVTHRRRDEYVKMHIRGKIQEQLSKPHELGGVCSHRLPNSTRIIIQRYHQPLGVLHEIRDTKESSNIRTMPTRLPIAVTKEAYLAMIL